MPAISIEGLRAGLDAIGLLHGRSAVTPEGGRLRVSQQSLTRLIPASLPVQLDRIAGGRLYIRTRLSSIGGMAEVVPGVSAAGRLRMEIRSFQAAGLLPIPVMAVTWAIRSFLPAHPSLSFDENNQLEIDLATLLRPFGIEIPRLSAVQVNDGEIVLEFGVPAAAVETQSQPVTTSAPAQPAGPPAQPANSAAPPVAAPAAPAVVPAPVIRDPVAVKEQIQAQFPASLPIASAPEVGQPPVRLSIRLRNPGAELLLARFRPEPPWVRVDPLQLPLAAGEEGVVRLEIDPGKISKENHRDLKVTASWSALVPAEGRDVSVSGEAVIAIEVPAPRRLFLCPNPSCEQILSAGDTPCRHCGAELQYCPVCGAPALANATVCSGKEHHPLGPRDGDDPPK